MPKSLLEVKPPPAPTTRDLVLAFLREQRKKAGPKGQFCFTPHEIVNAMAKTGELKGVVAIVVSLLDLGTIQSRVARCQQALDALIREGLVEAENQNGRRWFWASEAAVSAGPHATI